MDAAPADVKAGPMEADSDKARESIDETTEDSVKSIEANDEVSGDQAEGSTKHDSVKAEAMNVFAESPQDPVAINESGDNNDDNNATNALEVSEETAVVDVEESDSTTDAAETQDDGMDVDAQSAGYQGEALQSAAVNDTDDDKESATAPLHTEHVSKEEDEPPIEQDTCSIDVASLPHVQDENANNMIVILDSDSDDEVQEINDLEEIETLKRKRGNSKASNSNQPKDAKEKKERVKEVFPGPDSVRTDVILPEPKMAPMIVSDEVKEALYNQSRRGRNPDILPEPLRDFTLRDVDCAALKKRKIASFDDRFGDSTSVPIVVSINKNGATTNPSYLDVDQLRELARNLGVEGDEEMDHFYLQLMIANAILTVRLCGIERFFSVPLDSIRSSSLFRLTNIVFHATVIEQFVQYVKKWAKEDYEMESKMRKGSIWVTTAKFYNDSLFNELCGTIMHSSTTNLPFTTDSVWEKCVSNFMQLAKKEGRVDPKNYLKMTPAQCETEVQGLLHMYRAVRKKVFAQHYNSHRILKYLPEVLADLGLTQSVGLYAAYYFCTVLMQCGRDALQINVALGVLPKGTRYNAFEIVPLPPVEGRKKQKRVSSMTSACNYNVPL
jgi:hypothetical protein